MDTQAAKTWNGLDKLRLGPDLHLRQVLCWNLRVTIWTVCHLRNDSRKEKVLKRPFTDDQLYQLNCTEVCRITRLTSDVTCYF